MFLVLLNGFFVAAEFAMVKIRASRISQLVDEGNKRAKVAQSVVHNLDAYLSACQLGITLASLGLGWLGEPAIARLIEPTLMAMGVPVVGVHTIAFVIAFAIITFLHIVLGELAPKSLAIQRAEGTVLWISAPLMLFHKIMYPFIWMLNGTANALLRAFGIQPASEGELAHTEEEIRILVNQSHRSGLIDNTELALFDNIFEFADRIAREIMVPRIDMVTVDIEDSFEEILEVISREQHTRYPVTLGDKDHIIGFFHVKDIYLQMYRTKNFNLHTILRKMVMVHESNEISAILKQMQKNHTQMAVVVDEYGGTAGLITMEDIIEELVGEIQDEFDNELPPVLKTAEGYSVEGRVLIEEINDLVGTSIANDEVDTIGGWIYALVGDTPETGIILEHDGFSFLVEKVEGHRVERVFIKQTASKATESEVVREDVV